MGVLPRTLSVAGVASARPSVGRKGRAIAALAAFLFIALNVAIFMLPIDYRIFGAWAYPGVFLVTLIANAAMVFPVPYIPVVAHLLATADVVTLAIAAAAIGSAVGESTGWLVGRAERCLFSDHPLYRRLQRHAAHPWRSGGVLLAFAAVPNPAFDIAGLASGALGIPWRLFFVAVLSGRVIRFTALAWGAHAIGL